jgi:multiple sugar transport system permease protein
MPRRFTRQRLTPFLFLFPQLVLVALFAIYPLLWDMVLSLESSDFVHTSFVGFDQYIAAVHDNVFWAALRNTTWYTLGTVPLTVVAALAAAEGLKHSLAGKEVLRTVYLFPYLTSWVVIGLIWKWIYSVTYGPLDILVGFFGIPAINWLGNPSLTIPSIIVASVWHELGYYMVILLAGLNSIPLAYYEASVIDGANAWARFRYITLPLLRPILFVVVLLSMINSFKVFDQIYVMTNGGPGRASLMMVNYIYSVVIDGMNMSYGAALSVILLVVILVLTVAQRRLFRENGAEE